MVETQDLGILRIPPKTLVSKMAVVDAADKLEQVIRDDGRYARGAFEFLFAGLSYTVRQHHGQRADEEPQHVSGQALCEGLRELALTRWGAMALLVLNRWNLYGTRDFGEMVFLLVEHELMGKQDSDAIEDFDDVYDFQVAFSEYQPSVEELDEDE